MKKLISITVIFIFLLGLTAFQSINSFAEETLPQVSAVSAIVIDAATGTVLYEKNGYSRQFPASTTKIMTGLIALESGHDMKEMVKISEKAATTEGSSIYMHEGERISFEDLMYALMLRSGNDSAVALAELISGSTDEFARKMNQKAMELGAENTNFVTVNGLHDENHYTTAYDMSLIAREAMKNKTFRKIVSARYWNASRDIGSFNYFYNKNKVLYQYEGGNGIKIGYTTVAGRCLVASSMREGMELIAVVFSAPDWFNDVYKLMDYAYEAYESEVLIEEGERLAAVNIYGGTKGHTWLISEHDIAFPRKRDEKYELSFKIEGEKSFQAPVSRGEAAAKITIYKNGEAVCWDEVVFQEDIEEASEDSGTIFNNLLSFITKKQ